MFGYANTCSGSAGNMRALEDEDELVESERESGDDSLEGLSVRWEKSRVVSSNESV